MDKDCFAKAIGVSDMSLYVFLSHNISQGGMQY